MTQPPEPTPEERVAERIAERIAQLEEQVASLVRDNSTLTARAESLHVASVVSADSTDVAEVLRIVLSEMRKVVPYDSASVQELREGRLVIVGGVGFADLDVILGESFDIHNSDAPNGEVVHRRRPFLVSDTEQYRAFRRGLHVGAGIRSWLGLPLVFREELLGILALDKAEPDFYTDEHLRHAVAFASIAAAAMARRR